MFGHTDFSEEHPKMPGQIKFNLILEIIAWEHTTISQCYRLLQLAYIPKH